MGYVDLFPTERSMFLSLGHESYTGIADIMRLGIETVVHVE